MLEEKRTGRRSTYYVRDSIEASRVWPLRDFTNFPMLGVWDVCDGAMIRTQVTPKCQDAVFLERERKRGIISRMVRNQGEWVRNEFCNGRSSVSRVRTEWRRRLV